jgi:hypothetical protein
MIHPFEQILHKLADFGLLNDFEEHQKDDFLLEIERRIMPETDYFQFLADFNKITGKRHYGDVASRKLFYKVQARFSSDEITRAVTNANKNPYSKTNTNWLTPIFILEPDNLGQYLNYTPPSNGQVNQPKTKVKDGDFTKVQDF